MRLKRDIIYRFLKVYKSYIGINEFEAKKHLN